MQIVKVSFKDYNDMPFKIYIDWISSNENVSDFFLKKSFALLEDSELKFSSEWLSFLLKEPELELKDSFEKIDIYEKTLAQRLDLLNIIENSQNIVLNLHEIIAVLIQKDYDYKKNEKIQNEWLNKSVVDVCSYGNYLLNEFMQAEKGFISKLKPLKMSDEQRQAGFEDLNKNWAKYMLIDTLANGDILKYEQVLKMSLENIYANMIYKNHIANYEERLNEVYKAKQKIK
jgi:hypothetical protein